MEALSASAGSIPLAVRRSFLMTKGGYAIYEGLFNDELFRSLSDEAIGSYEHAQESDVPVSDEVMWRGGNPARRFLSASGGIVQDAFYQASEIQAILTDLCGVSIRPTGSRGTFTYYARKGDFLAIHRDIETCDLAVITCLHDSNVEGGGGRLAVYPERVHEPLAAIRATPDKGCLRQSLLPGQTLLLFGGIVPHQVLPVGDRQVRIVSILCYAAAHI